MTFTPAAGITYYLVVPRNGGSEGSYGTDSDGAERPIGLNACAPRKFAGCSLVCSGGQNPGASCTTSANCPGGCTGMHFGQSCTSDAGCAGQCGPWPDLSCTANSQCRVCSGDHTVRRTPTVAPAWRAALQRRIDLDFGKASSYAVLQLLSDVSDLPILVHGDIAANVNVLMHDVTVDAALDEVLLQAGAKRADIRCLRIVARSASNVALDGAGRNSPYSGALVRHLATSGDDLNAMLIAVRNDVMRQTDRKQVPWEHSALTRRYYFNGGDGASAAPPADQLRLSEASDAWNATRDTAVPSMA